MITSMPIIRKISNSSTGWHKLLNNIKREAFLVEFTNLYDIMIS
jgi:hypothetical protein